MSATSGTRIATGEKVGGTSYVGGILSLGSESKTCGQGNEGSIVKRLTSYNGFVITELIKFDAFVDLSKLKD